MDRACGYAALTLVEPNFRVLTVELKVNLLSVASAERLLARGASYLPGARSRSALGTHMPGREEMRHVATILTTIISVRQVCLTLVEHRRPRLV
jgi:acyl-coenzyme A thioesterase PaaI-like protein